MAVLNIVVIGLGGVGKSAIIIKFLRGKFIKNYDPTLEELYRKDLIVDDIPSIINIMDTAGQEAHITLRDKFLKRGDGFIYVYSLAHIVTISNFEDEIRRIRIIFGVDKFPLVIVGNKVDIKDTDTNDQGKILAKNNGCHYFKTSAKTGKNINSIFDQIVREVRQYKSRKTDMASETKIAKKNNCTLL